MIPFLLFMFIATTAMGEEPVQLSVQKGKAPLQVRITGPKKLIDFGKGQYSKWVGCNFNIDWGDRQPVPFERDCARLLAHVYLKSGVYTIKASTFHPNPDDSHTTDWSAEAIVTVE